VANEAGGDGGTPIDAAVELYDGQQVDGPVDCARHFCPIRRNLSGCYGENDDVRARPGVEYYDMPVLRSIVRDAAKKTTASRNRSGHREKVRSFSGE